MRETAADAKAAAATTKEIAAADVTRMRIAVVILNWNTEGFLREFLPGLIRSCSVVDGAEVVVADNASTDGSMKVMREQFPDVRTLQFGENLGFTGGYNRAFAELYGGTDAPEYFLLINSDIEVTENWLQPLVDWMDSHPECGACAPKLHSWKERDRFEYAGAAGGHIDRYGYPFCRGRVLKRLETDNGQYDTPADVFWATGACLMIRSRLYHEYGGLDSRFFAHMEEIDLCWRLRSGGHRVTVVPQSVVYHVGGGTLPQSSPFKLYLNYRNNLLMLDNNLAKAFALKMYGNGEDAVTAARKGKRKAERRMLCRMTLDGLSAAVYLLTLKPECFKAVLKAHKEYRRLRKGTDVKGLTDFLSESGKTVKATGIYRKWIIMESLLKGRGIFASIREEDFD